MHSLILIHIWHIHSLFLMIYDNYSEGLPATAKIEGFQRHVKFSWVGHQHEHRSKGRSLHADGPTNRTRVGRDRTKLGQCPNEMGSWTQNSTQPPIRFHVTLQGSVILDQFIQRKDIARKHLKRIIGLRKVPLSWHWEYQNWNATNSWNLV